LDGAQAANVYAAFLADTLDIMRRVPEVRCGIAYLPEGGAEFFHALAPDMELVLQQGASLGERLDHLITQTLAGGAAQVVVMDSDSPTLPADYVAAAFAQLDAGADVVFGPCRDGGYYLVGMQRPLPMLLRAVQMSTPTVLADTLAIAEQIGVHVALLPEWYDVDTGEELAQLARELHRTEAAPHTRRQLAALTWLPLPAAALVHDNTHGSR
jgi:rSAM/selenodomain-associated transferase 1